MKAVRLPRWLFVAVAALVMSAGCESADEVDPGGYGWCTGQWTCNSDAVLVSNSTTIDGIMGDPVVMRDGAEYAMYYGAVRGDFTDQETVRIFRATSADGVTWNRPGLPLLIPGAVGQWDAAAVETPSIVKGSDGTYRLYYSGTYTTENEDKYQIGLATSTDGVNFTKHPANPVIRLGATGEFDDYSIIDSSVLYDTAARQYKIWYSALSSKLAISIGMATSSDGVTWQKQGQVMEMTLERNKATDFGVMGTSVAFDGQVYRMVYSILSDNIPDHPTGLSLWYATSVDGKAWTKAPAPIVVAPKVKAGASVEVSSPTLLLEADRARVWFVGTRTDFSTYYDVGIGYAEQVGAP